VQPIRLIGLVLPWPEPAPRLPSKRCRKRRRPHAASRLPIVRAVVVVALGAESHV